MKLMLLQLSTAEPRGGKNSEIINPEKVITILKTCIKLLWKLEQMFPKGVTTIQSCNYYNKVICIRISKDFLPFRLEH